VCGEETALLEALEGRRAEVRPRPPYPAEKGLHGWPTVVNNVETLCNVPAILELGPEAYAALGTSASSGTKVLSLNRGFARPGLLELEFGLTLQEVVDEAGGGRDGAELEALLVGGPMGSVVFREDWDAPVCYGALAARGIQLGHGGLIAIPRGTDWRALLVHWLEFFAHESCGKCVPCALGSARALELARREGGARGELEPLLELIADASLCAFGQLVPAPVRAVLRRLARGEASIA
jgi:NADH:ubiquinone oxidoreductase subunit F (NADH-binding)